VYPYPFVETTGVAPAPGFQDKLFNLIGYRLTKEDYRSLLKISPENEAANCDTPEECRELIEAELERENPRDWVIGIFNERAEELREADG